MGPEWTAAQLFLSVVLFEIMIFLVLIVYCFVVGAILTFLYYTIALLTAFVRGDSSKNEISKSKNRPPS